MSRPFHFRRSRRLPDVVVLQDPGLMVDGAKLEPVSDSVRSGDSLASVAWGLRPWGV